MCPACTPLPSTPAHPTARAITCAAGPHGEADGCYISDDGCVHVVADRVMLRDALRRVDLDQARVLTQASGFCCAGGRGQGLSAQIRV